MLSGSIPAASINHAFMSIFFLLIHDFSLFRSSCGVCIVGSIARYFVQSEISSWTVVC